MFVAGANVAECFPITTDYIWRARESGAQADRPRSAHDADRPHRRPVPPRAPGQRHRRLQRHAARDDRSAAGSTASSSTQHTTGWDEVERAVERYTPECAANDRRRARVDDRARRRAVGPAETSMLLHARGIEHHTKGVENCLAAINLVRRHRQDRQAGLRLRDDHRPGQRPGRARARAEVRPAARRPRHREPRAPRVHRRRVGRRRSRRSRGKGLSAVPLIEAIHDGRDQGPAARSASIRWCRCPTATSSAKRSSRLEFFAVIDFFLSETRALRRRRASRLADGGGRRDDDQRRGARHPSTAGRRPPAGAREDWRIICELAQRLGAGDKFAYDRPREIFEELRVASQRRRRRLRGHHLGTHRPRDGRVLAVPVARSSRHAAPVRRLAVRPSRRQGALSSRSTGGPPPKSPTPSTRSC